MTDSDSGSADADQARPAGQVQDPAALLETAKKSLGAYREDAAIERIDQVLTTGPADRVVVVVGEIKRGKSTLVNALLGIRDLSPVGVEATTSASLVFVGADSAHPAGQADLIFPGAARRVPVAELADWVTVDGARVRDRSAESLPTRAVVSAASDYLADRTVIDTPGVGGLDVAHAQLAAQSAGSAAVLVMVCDGGTVISAPEMDFLRSTGEGIESVIVAVTKTDKNLRRWRQIVEENRRLIRRHLSRDVPVVGVSGVRALAAAGIADADRRAAVLQACGITELRRLIDARLNLGEQQVTVDAMRTAIEGLHRLHERVGSEIAVLRDGAEALPELTERRAELDGLKEQSARWEQLLNRDLTLARTGMQDDLDTDLAEVRKKWTDRINNSGMTLLRSRPQAFTAEIEADLLRVMTETIAAYLARVEKVVTPLFDDPAVWSEIMIHLQGELRPDLETGEVASSRQGLIDPSLVTIGVIGGTGLAGVIPGVAVGAVTGGVGIAVGAVWAGINLGYKALRSGKTNLLAWLRETLTTTRQSTLRIIEVASTNARPEIVLRYRDWLRAETARVQKQIAQAQEAARLDAAEREDKLAKWSNNRRVIAGQIKALENQITVITEGAGR